MNADALALRDEAALKMGKLWTKGDEKRIYVDEALVVHLAREAFDGTKTGWGKVYDAVTRARPYYDCTTHEFVAPKVSGLYIDGDSLAGLLDKHLTELFEKMARGEEVMNASDHLRLTRYLSEATDGVMKINDWSNIDPRIPRGVVKVEISKCSDPRVKAFALANPKCISALVYKPENI